MTLTLKSGDDQCRYHQGVERRPVPGNSGWSPGSTRQSVTVARTLADTPKNMASGESSDAAKGITAASSILRGVSAAQQLTNVGASASITAGASVSQSSSSMDAADAAIFFHSGRA